jgi:hypothetical protein
LSPGLLRSIYGEESDDSPAAPLAAAESPPPLVPTV